MIRSKLIVAATICVLSLSFAASALAQPADQRTYFTFSAPFELPGGKRLPAGKYTFRVLDSPSNRHVVQVLSEDGKQMYATVLAIPAQRQDPPNEPEIRFMEAAANMPPAIRTWWYPGRTIGHEFIYPKEHARRLAARQPEPVLTVSSDATSTEQMQTADLERISPSGQETPVTAEPERRTAQTTPQRGAVDTTPVRRPVTTADATRTQERTSLPRTASPLPMIGLGGLLALALAGALRLRRA